jgi:hypothetical protein
MEYTKSKIEETYKIALKLGLEDKATEIEKKIFREMLFRIAMSAVDESRMNINQMLHTESNDYANCK